MNELPVILVVEDDDALQDFAKDALINAGFDFTVSSSAEEGLALLKSGAVRYRALLTDINLGDGMSGWELARQAREVDPSFPVVYMSGAGADQWAAQGVPNSIFLEKPFAPAQLVTALAQLLNTGNSPS